MKKFLKIIAVCVLGILSVAVFFLVRYANLDTYIWDSDNRILTIGEKQFKGESVDQSSDVELEKQIGKISDEDSSFRIWSIKGESSDDRIAIEGFMFPADTYSRIND